MVVGVVEKGGGGSGSAIKVEERGNSLGRAGGRHAEISDQCCGSVVYPGS